MKKVLVLAVTLLLVISLVACTDNTALNPSENTSGNTTQADTLVNTEPEADTTAQNTTGGVEVLTQGIPLGWPQNEYTSLVPTPDVGGKTLTDGDMIGELFTIDLEWTIEQGTAYAQQLADAGFGDDCAEKFEKYGYIDRTSNGVNVQLLDLFGKVNISVMKIEQ